MSLEKSLFVVDNEDSPPPPVGGVRLLKQLSVPPDFSINGEVPAAAFMTRQTSSRSLGCSSSTAESSFDSLSPEPRR